MNELGLEGMLKATTSGGFSAQSLGLVILKSGGNDIVIHEGWGFYDIQDVDLVPASPQPMPQPGLYSLSDPAATAETVALLHGLQRSYGKTTMLGVYADSDAEYVVKTTGERPSIMGGDLVRYSSQEVAHDSKPQGIDEIDRLIDRGHEGYVITVSWHWCAPSKLLETKEQPWWKGFYIKATRFDVSKALADKDSQDYRALVHDIDLIAVQLRKLQSAGVPVLWRPLHEAGGGWFWWGAGGPEAFVSLWHLLYERLTLVDGVHNLVWVYTGGDGSAWYPGDDVVDIVGVDEYPKDFRDPKNAVWQQLIDEHGSQKMLAISEFGGTPEVQRMEELGEFWAYAVSWSGVEGPKKNHPEDLRRIYTSGGVETMPATPVLSPAVPSKVF